MDCRNPIYQIEIEVIGRISLNYTKKDSEKVGAWGVGGVGDKSIWHLDYLGVCSKSAGSEMK